MSGGDAVDHAAQAAAEGLHGLGTGHDVPPLLLEHAHRQGILVGDALAEDAAAFPLPEEHLAQVRVDDQREAHTTSKGRGRLCRAPERADVDGVDVLGRQPLGHPLGFLLSFR